MEFDDYGICGSLVGRLSVARSPLVAGCCGRVIWREVAMDELGRSIESVLPDTALGRQHERSLGAAISTKEDFKSHKSSNRSTAIVRFPSIN